jgi:glyoxylase-like metal-dependent hydrolase (beta-lactamase superfamily II)
MNESDAPTSLAARLHSLGVTVFERGWLSSNNVLIQGSESTTLVDSGYYTHASQTLSLIQSALKGRGLDMLLNTHLHSDHCGGNAALQTAFPNLKTLIPPGQAESVAAWDPVALTYEPTGQGCPSFGFQGVLEPGTSMMLGEAFWEVHAAKGHDPHSIVLFEPLQKVLISADALWENGFGIVFPELEGAEAFDDVANTLTLIESLAPKIIVPGHGAVFEDVDGALQRARGRLEQFVKDPDKHRRHALKVLIKFKLLEWQRASKPQMLDWYVKTPYLASIERRSPTSDLEILRHSLDSLIQDLARSNALRIEGDFLFNV